MVVLDRLEQRLALPGDSENVRLQKTLGVLLIFLSVINVFLNLVPQLYFQFYAPSILFALLGALYFFGGLLILAVPRTFNFIVRLLPLLGIVVFSFGQVLYGGFASGMTSVQWNLAVIVAVVMVVGARFSAWTFVLSTFALLAVTLFEPFAIGIGPEISTAARMLTNFFSLEALMITLFFGVLYLFLRMEHYRRRSNDLLLNILPQSIATRLKEDPHTIADGYSEATVLFADIVDFTTMSSDKDPDEIVNFLNEVFSLFDDLAAKYKLEKIKTIGDAYMVAAGIPEPRPDHTEAIVNFAIDVLKTLESQESFHGQPIRLRVGINRGPVVAGVIGHQKFSYDLWGDTVNVASRMES
ncbi:MAG: adenylate/guanylate cyclase domain-containing protein, partial [Candidatus Promineifilaceae bacterium]